jgi:hypothetical protein
VQFGTAPPDAGTKAHDGIAVNAGNALNGADALAFGKAIDGLSGSVSGGPEIAEACLAIARAETSPSRLLPKEFGFLHHRAT